MRLRPVLSSVCAIALLAGAAPAFAADDAADVTLVVVADGTPQTWSAGGVQLGAGPELVGAGTGACEVGGVVDIDPTERTISVTVARAATTADVSVTVASTSIGMLNVVTPGLSGVTLTATPEVAIITWQAAPALGEGCSTDTAVFRYAGTSDATTPVGPPLDEVTLGVPTATPDAPAAAAPVVVAAPTFAG